MQGLRLVRIYLRNGYTVFELLFIAAVLGVMALVYSFKVTDPTRNINVLSVDRLASDARAMTNLVYSKCHLHPDCDVSLPSQVVNLDGRIYSLNNGWLDAGDALHTSQIDAHVNHDGFYVELLSERTTRFKLAKAPDPANCAVLYHDAWHEPENHKFFIVEKATTGC